MIHTFSNYIFLMVLTRVFATLKNYKVIHEKILTTSAIQFGSMGKPGSCPFPYEIIIGSNILCHWKTSLLYSTKQTVLVKQLAKMLMGASYLLPCIQPGNGSLSELSTILGLTITTGRSSFILSTTISPNALVKRYTFCQPNLFALEINDENQVSFIPW